MNDIRAEYERKKQSVEQILEKIRSGDKIFVGFYGGEPRTILRRIHEIAPRVSDVEIWKATDMEDFPVFTDPAMEGHFEMKSIFYGKTAREISKTRPVEEAIGENVAELIRDGDCIQLGIGGTSNVVARKLVDKHDLGIHSEMFTDSMMELMKKGVINCSRKNLNPGLAVASFAWGSRQLYDFIDWNRDIVFRRSSYVNDPFIIAQNDNMVSINTTLQVDLTGQVCSESIGPRQYSGTGGAFDFAYGALHSRGGRGLVAVQSTAKNGTISRITPMLTEGAMVSITRNVVDNIVTEYGVAPMRGRTVRQRVQNLIAVAHPDFREELKKKAEYLMLW